MLKNYNKILIFQINFELSRPIYKKKEQKKKKKKIAYNIIRKVKNIKTFFNGFD